MPGTVLGPQCWALNETKSLYPWSSLSEGLDDNKSPLPPPFTNGVKCYEKENLRRDVFPFDIISQRPQQATLTLRAEGTAGVTRGQGRAVQVQRMARAKVGRQELGALQERKAAPVTRA